MKSGPRRTGKEFMGQGWAFPPEIDADRGRVARVKEEEDIEQSIRIILGTSRGSRVMRLAFGCGIHDLVFEVIDTSLLESVQRNVLEALTEFEPRIEVERVEVDPREAYRSRLLVEIHYRNRRTNQSGNYVYPFYFKEIS